MATVFSRKVEAWKMLVGATVGVFLAGFGVDKYMDYSYASKAHTKHEDVKRLALVVADQDIELQVIKLRSQRRELVLRLHTFKENGHCNIGAKLSVQCAIMTDDIKNIDDELIVLFPKLPRPKTRGLKRR